MKMAVYNDRGIIAENYYDLQGLGVLDAARDSVPLPTGSLESALRAVLQAVEIAILNLVDLLSRAVRDLEEERYKTAALKILWARGFHRVLSRLSLIPQQLGGVNTGDQACVLHLADSPALGDYMDHLKKFDRVILAHIKSKKLPLSELMKILWIASNTAWSTSLELRTKNPRFGSLTSATSAYPLLPHHTVNG
jgi:hypothetical protein